MICIAFIGDLSIFVKQTKNTEKDFLVWGKSWGIMASDLGKSDAFFIIRASV
jgi:hypothetical protein